MTIHAAPTNTNDYTPEPSHGVYRQVAYKTITGVTIATDEDNSTEIDARGFKSCLLFIPDGETVGNAITFFAHAAAADGAGTLVQNTTPATLTFTPGTADRAYDISSLVANMGAFRMQVATAAINNCKVYLEG